MCWAILISKCGLENRTIDLLYALHLKFWHILHIRCSKGTPPLSWTCVRDYYRGYLLLPSTNRAAHVGKWTQRDIYWYYISKLLYCTTWSRPTYNSLLFCWWSTVTIFNLVDIIWHRKTRKKSRVELLNKTDTNDYWKSIQQPFSILVRRQSLNVKDQCLISPLLIRIDFAKTTFLYFLVLMSN